MILVVAYLSALGLRRGCLVAVLDNVDGQWFFEFLHECIGISYRLSIINKP
jgi:hypothetical protein